MADGTPTRPSRLTGKPAVDPSLPTNGALPQGYVLNNPLPKGDQSGVVPGGMAPVGAGAPPNPMRDQKTQLEAQIRQLESTGQDSSALRAQLAGVYDQMNPGWRLPAPTKDVASGMSRPATPIPGINIDSIPTRWDEYKNPDGSLNLDKIEPVSGRKVNTSTVLMSGIEKMFKGVEGDSLEDLAYKIEGGSKARSDIAPLLNSPDEAVSTILGLVNKFGGKQLPSQSLGPEEKAYLEAAFQVAPGRKFATIDDVPDDYINFAIGYGLLGMAKGDGLQGFAAAGNAGLANAQQGLDQQFAQDTAQFEASKALNMALANRAGKISDANFQQEGYYAKDMRDLVEKVTSATLNLDRQTQVAVLSTIMPMIQNGDSDRYNAYVQTIGPMLKEKFGITLPQALPKSSNELKTDASIVSMQIKDARLQQVMDFAAELQPFEKEKLMTQISILDGKDEEATARVDLLRKQISGYDKKLANETMLAGARAESLRAQAKAALIRASKTGTPAGDPTIKRLQAISGINASMIGTVAKEKESLIKQIAAEQKELNDLVFLRVGMKDKNSQITFDARQRNAEKKKADLEKKLADVETQMTTINQAQSNAVKFLEGLPK